MFPDCFPEEKEKKGIFIVHVDNDLDCFICIKDTLEGTNNRDVSWNGRFLNKNYLGGRKYNTLYHERDFKPGVLIPENIMQCITKSSRVLIILTPSLIKSDWCREEFYWANLYKKAIVIRMKRNENEESEIQDLLKLDVNKTIDMHMKRITYIKWNGSENDTDFWRKLAYSLPHKKAETPSDSFVTLMKRIFRFRTRPYLEELNPLSAPGPQDSPPYEPNDFEDDLEDGDFDYSTIDLYAQINSIAFVPGIPYEEIKDIIDDDDDVGEGGLGKVFKGKLKGQYVAIKKLHEDNPKGRVLHDCFICILKILKIRKTLLYICSTYKFKIAFYHIEFIFNSISFLTCTISVNQDLMKELKSMCLPAQNILPLLSFCLNPPCLISQYMEKGSLRKKLEEHDNPLSWAQRLNIALGISRGLRHLHEHDLVHGDIKSDNILLDKHLEPKIGDFGSAQFLYSDSTPEETNSTSKGKKSHKLVQNHVGTERYLPRWFKIGRTVVAVRKQVDVYSFGIVLLEILSDRIVSYRQETLRDFIDNHIEQFEEYTTFENKYPSEYITQADTEHQNIRENNPFCCERCVSISLPFLFCMIGSQCTKTGTQAADLEPPPWKDVPKIDEINLHFQHTYNCYHPNLTDDERERSSHLVSVSVSQDSF